MIKDKMETVADIAVFSLEPTDSAGQRWESWVRRFENYIVAKNIQNDKIMKAMLLHYAGEAVFELSDVAGVARRCSAVVSTSACHAGGPGSLLGPGTL